MEIHSLSWFKNNYSRGTWMVSNSWFWPRSWCQGHEIEPRVGVDAGYGACFRFSLPFPMPLPCSHSPFVSKRKRRIITLVFSVPYLRQIAKPYYHFFTCEKFFLKIVFIYVRQQDSQRKRELSRVWARKNQAPSGGAPCRTWSWITRITSWADSRCPMTALPRCPSHVKIYFSW